MRRALPIVLALVLGFGPLAACGKKAPPALPEGEQLKVLKKGRKQKTGVTKPYAPGGKESGKAIEPAATPPDAGQPAAPGDTGEDDF